MCTAITYKTKDHYFGRNLDLEYSYKETVTITPRNFTLHFRRMGKLDQHFAIIGMAYICDGYPLYYDGTNEKGLSMAALNFPGNADYKAYRYQKDNIVPFELIPAIYKDEIVQLKTKVKIKKKCVQRATTYVADFVYLQDGKTIVEDTKGFRTKEYELKKKMMRAFLGIEIKEI